MIKLLRRNKIEEELGKNVKIFNNESFGYTKVTVERPMQ